MNKQINVKFNICGTKPPLTREIFARSRKSGGPTSRTPNFEGRCDNLKGCMFDCSGSWKYSKFSKNLRGVIKYVGKEYTP